MRILRLYSEGSHAKKTRKVTDKIDTGLTLATHGGTGAAFGYTLGGKKGAIIGGTLGAAEGAMKDAISKHYRRKEERRGKNVKEPQEAQRSIAGEAILDTGTVAVSSLIGSKLGGPVKLRRELEKAAKEGRVISELGKELHYHTGRKKGAKVGALIGVGVAANEWAKRKALKHAHKKDKEEEKQKERKKEGGK